MSIRLTIASVKNLYLFWNVVVAFQDRLLQICCLPFSQNMVLLLPTCVDKPMMVLVIRREARIMSSFPLALYVHCSSHCLNLAVSSLAEVAVRNMIGIVNRVSIFSLHIPNDRESSKKQLKQHSLNLLFVS